VVNFDAQNVIQKMLMYSYSRDVLLVATLLGKLNECRYENKIQRSINASWRRTPHDEAGGRLVLGSQDTDRPTPNIGVVMVLPMKRIGVGRLRG
jgi:hypothetical protein